MLTTKELIDPNKVIPFSWEYSLTRNFDENTIELVLRHYFTDKEGGERFVETIAVINSLEEFLKKRERIVEFFIETVERELKTF